MLVNKPRLSVAVSLGALALLTAVAALAGGCQPLPAPTSPPPLASSPRSSGQLNLAIVHSNDTWGYLTPCG